MHHYTKQDLEKIFRGCETALNIIRDQIGDVDGDAVWYPWDETPRVPVIPSSIIDEVQDAWEALPIPRDEVPEDLVGAEDLAALRRIADGEGVPLRLRWAAPAPDLYQIMGYEVFERVAKRQGNSAMVQVPAGDVGKRFKIVRIDPR